MSTYVQRLKELRLKRGQIVKQMQDIIESAAAEKRSPTAEEQSQHKDLFGEQETVKGEIDTLERQVELDRQMAEDQSQEERNRRAGGGGTGDESPEERTRRECRSFILTGQLGQEMRALQQDVDSAGGFMVMPSQFVNELIKFVDDQVFIRARANVIQVPEAKDLGAPSLEADPDDAEWTSELATGGEDSAMTFGGRTLFPQPLAKRIKVSKKLLRSGGMDAEQLVRERLGYKFAITEEKSAMTGSGNKQMLGVFTASNDGISTARDVSTGNTATAITWTNLIRVKYKLKGAYWPNAEWLFHRDVVAEIAVLLDADGRPLWQPSLQAGQPDRILNSPLLMSEYAPNTLAANQYVGMFGDFSKYWIAEAMDFQIQRLVELYAETNQDGFIGRQEIDGMPVLEEAFARVQMGS